MRYREQASLFEEPPAEFAQPSFEETLAEKRKNRLEGSSEDDGTYNAHEEIGSTKRLTREEEDRMGMYTKPMPAEFRRHFYEIRKKQAKHKHIKQ